MNKKPFHCRQRKFKKINHRKNEELLEEIYREIGSRLDYGTADKIIKILLNNFGRQRFTIPSIKYFYRRERDLRIKRDFRGGNYKEIGMRFNLSMNQVRRIVHGG